MLTAAGISTFFFRPLGTVRTIPETRRLLEELMYGVQAAARARGVAVPDDAVRRSIATLDQVSPLALGNMREIVQNRPSELDAEIGTVIRLAKKTGVDVIDYT